MNKKESTSLRIDTAFEETSEKGFFLKKAFPVLLRIFLMWLYGVSLLRYLCETLHIHWEAEWWNRILGVGEHGSYLFAFLRSPQQMANSFYHLENLVIKRISYATDQELLPYITTLPFATTFPFLLGLSVVLMCLVFLLVYGKRIAVEFWVLLHIVILSLPFLFRETPSFWSFFLLLAMILAMIGSTTKVSLKKEPRGRPEYRYIGALLLLFVTFLLASCLLPKEQYAKTTVWLKEQKKELTLWGEQMLARMEGENGRFPTWGKRYTDDSPAFRIVLKWQEQSENSPQNEAMISQTNLYLKEYAAVHYGRHGWEEYRPEEKARLEELMATYHQKPEEWMFRAEHTLEEMRLYEDLRGLFTTVEVEPLKTVKNRAFLLYGASEFGVGKGDIPSPVADLYMTAKGKKISQSFTYPLFYYERSRNQETWQRSYGILEGYEFDGWEPYDAFVYETCLGLPEGLGEGFYQLVEELEASAEALSLRYPYISKESLKMQALKSWFYEHATYDTAPGLAPEGWNMVEYFLTESQRGYCVHFACSAVLLLRAMGIPARYAEGYLVKLPELYEQGEKEKTLYTTWEDGKEIRVLEGTVTGESAHAWAEVWLEGIGFVPIEYTVGTEENGISAGLPGLDRLPGAAEQEEEENREEEKEDEESQENNIEEPPNIQEPLLPEQTKPVETKPDRKDGAAALGEGRTLFWIALALPLFLAFAAGGVRFWQKEHYRRMSNRNKALYWYRKLDRLSLSNLPNPEFSSRQETAKRIAEKARFSELEVTWEEICFLESCYLEQKAIKNVKKG